MATSKDFKSLAKRLRIRADNLSDTVENTMRKVGLTVHQVATNLTPVDTGLARNNWFMSFVFPVSAGALRGPDTGGSESLSDALHTSNAYSGEGSIFITNNTPYIVPLDRGHSAQAPGGMSAGAIAAGSLAAQRLLRKPLGN